MVSGNKTFYGLLAAGIAFIVIGAVSSVSSNIPRDVPLDGTVPPGLSDVLTPDMNAGNTASIAVSGSTFNVTIKDPDQKVIKSENNTSSFNYEFTAQKAGVHTIEILNTGDTEGIVTGHAPTKANPLAFGGNLMLVITGIIITGISLRFRKR